MPPAPTSTPTVSHPAHCQRHELGCHRQRQHLHRHYITTTTTTTKTTTINTTTRNLHHHHHPLAPERPKRTTINTTRLLLLRVLSFNANVSKGALTLGGKFVGAAAVGTKVVFAPLDADVVGFVETQTVAPDVVLIENCKLAREEGLREYVDKGTNTTVQCWTELTRILDTEQQTETELDIFAVVSASVLAIACVLCATSKFYFKDPNPDYPCVFGCVLGPLDFCSDLVFLSSLLRLGDIFNVHFLVGLSSLVLVALLNFLGSAYLLQQERARNPLFMQETSKRCCPLVCLILLSFPKADMTSLLASSLFSRKTKAFLLPWSHELSVRLRVLTLLQIVFEV